MMAFSRFFIPLVFSFNIIFGIEGLENATTIVERNGYPIELHEVETEDGYILNVYRIPNGKQSNGTTPNPYPVLLQHGIFGCGENFVWLNQSMGYLLADHGYDVWVMNVRGSWHSIKHRTLNPGDEAFWRFTWHEMGIYDIPATIDYILNNTGAHNLSFIGHSQGTTTMFVMGAFRPEYNDKVNGMIAIGPISVLLNPRHVLIRLVAPFYRVFKVIGNILHIQRIPPLLSNEQAHAANHFLCGQRFSPRWLCRILISLAVGPGDDQFDTVKTEFDLIRESLPQTENIPGNPVFRRGILPITSALVPSSCSYHQLIHYGQNLMDRKFTTFDWGSAAENLRRYGSEKPVEYNVTNISFKVALYVASNDVFVSNQTVQLLENTLPNVSEVYRVPYETWTHVDFIWAKEMDIYEHPNLLETLHGFNQN